MNNLVKFIWNTPLHMVRYPGSAHCIDTFSIFVICMYDMLSVGVFVSQCVHRGQRITFREWFSPSNMVSWIKLRLPGFLGKPFHPLSHLPSSNSGDPVFMKIMSIFLGQSLLKNWDFSIPDSLPTNYTYPGSIRVLEYLKTMYLFKHILFLCADQFQNSFFWHFEMHSYTIAGSVPSSLGLSYLMITSPLAEWIFFFFLVY